MDGIGDSPLVGEGVGDCGGNKWIMLLEALAIAGFIASFGYEEGGSCGLTDPDSESEDDDLPDDRESDAVKLERGGGGLDPKIPFPWLTIFKDNVLLLFPVFLVLLKICRGELTCFSVWPIEAEIFEVAPSKHRKLAELS